MTSSVHSLRKLYYRLRRMPGITRFFRSRYDRKFDSAADAHLFRGIFDSMASAVASAPSARKIGYNHPGPAAMYRNRMSTVFATDYPVLFWLQKRIQPDCRIFDWGGHVGVSYYAYETLLEWPRGASWMVCDVPAVIEEGRVIAQENQKSSLQFTDDPDLMSGSDIMVASGSLQYIELDLADVISRIPEPPPHLIINLLPVHQDRSFVTLQNIGTAYCPYRIFRDDEFVQSVTKLGYSLIDRWENPQKNCFIPFHEEYSVHPYTGFYFCRQID